MFIRSKRVKGRTYYQVVSTYREGGKVRHRTHASLGAHPTIEGAYQEALERWTIAGRPWVPGYPWFERVIALDALREHPDGWVARKHLDEQQRQQEQARAAEGQRQAEEKRRRKKQRREKAQREQAEWAAFYEQQRRAGEQRRREREERAAEDQRRQEEWAAFEASYEASRAAFQATLDSLVDKAPQASARILGVEWPCDMNAAKAAYRRKARECHPDHGGSVKAMAEVNEAYSALERYYERCGKLS